MIKNFGLIFVFLIVSLLGLIRPIFAENSIRESASKAQPACISKALAGQEMIFARRYVDAERIFTELKSECPSSPAGDFGLMASLEMRMLEREDFHLEKEFLKVAKEGVAKVARIGQSNRPDVWDLFLSGSLLGLDGFFYARKGKWWDAYTMGTKSRQIFHHVKEIEPSFVDADFGLGMYIFWRSVFVRDFWFLRMFPDRREEGIAIVENVAKNGDFSKDLAWVSLAVMYFEQKRYDDARIVLQQYINRFPQNVILRTILGRVFIVDKRYDDAIGQFKKILDIDASLKKPHYFLGVAYTLSNRPEFYEIAEKELYGFVDSETSKHWKASAYFWLGRISENRGDKEEAKRRYEEVLKLNPEAKVANQRIRALGSGL